jgi:hypothetical protein
MGIGGVQALGLGGMAVALLATEHILWSERLSGKKS